MVANDIVDDPLVSMSESSLFWMAIGADLLLIY